MRKKITTTLLTIITILSLFCSSKIVCATEMEENNNTSYSSNSTVTFVYSLSVEIRYVDEDGTPLKAKKVIDGDEEKQFHITAEEIDGYKLKNTIGNPNGKFGEDFEVTFVYKKINQNANNNGNNQNNQNDGNNNSNNHNNDGNSNTNNSDNNNSSNNSSNDSNNNSTNKNNTNNSTNTNNQNQSNNITQNKQQSSNNNQIIDGVKTGDYYYIIIITIGIGILLTISGLIVLFNTKQKH